MTSQPDKLFRSKLEDFQKPAPAAAWNKIEASLDKSGTKGLWMKIAAGLILLAIATLLLWPAYESGNAPQLSNTPSQQPDTKSEDNDQAKIDSEKTVPVVAQKTTEEMKINTIEKTNPIRKEEPVLVAQQKYEYVNEQVSNESVSETQNTSTQEVILAQHENTDASTPETPASQTIVYTSSEVNARFLKKASPIEATSEDKKTSSIQKLMGLAYNLKNNDTGLGDLRQKKNEILALNFRDKKEGQN